MSESRAVPAVVPSLAQSLLPLPGVQAAKYTYPISTFCPVGDELTHRG